MPSHLTRYRALRVKADAYYEANKAYIETEMAMENAAEIKSGMPQLLADGFMVWCRNPSVTTFASPCEDLSCPYKSQPPDVTIGTSACQFFQVTRHSTTWESAEQVAPFASVEVQRKWGA